jgi:drug/metabolite transporter (DMT)-like permease
MSVFAFTLMAVSVKLVQHISPFTTVFVRFAVGVGMLGILAMMKVIKLNFVRSPLLLLRGLSGSISVALFYIAIVHVGMGKSSVYSYAYPVFASLLSHHFLKERISIAQWTLIFSAFVGIILLAVDRIVSEGFSWFELLAILSAVTNAISIVIVRKLHETDDSYAIFFAQSIVGFWIFILPANIPEISGTMGGSWLLLVVGLSGMAAQLLNTEGYRHIPVSKGSPFHMLIPVLNVAAGILFFGETLSLTEGIGALVVVASCVGLMAVAKK